jgi:hypothetical protein
MSEQGMLAISDVNTIAKVNVKLARVDMGFGLPLSGVFCVVALEFPVKEEMKGMREGSEAMPACLMLWRQPNGELVAFTK